MYSEAEVLISSVNNNELFCDIGELAGDAACEDEGDCDGDGVLLRVGEWGEGEEDEGGEIREEEREGGG